MSLERLIIFSLIALSASAHADDTGFFAGLALGEARLEVATDVEDNDFVAKVFGGYALNRYVATELTYLHGASFNYYFGSPANPEDLSLDLSAINVSILGMLPLGSRVSIVGKAGFARWDVDEVLIQSPPNGGRQASSRSGEDVSYGAGLQFNLKRFLSLRLEYEAIELPNDLRFYTMTFGGLWKF